MSSSYFSALIDFGGSLRTSEPLERGQAEESSTILSALGSARDAVTSAAAATAIRLGGCCGSRARTNGFYGGYTPGTPQDQEKYSFVNEFVKERESANEELQDGRAKMHFGDGSSYEGKTHDGQIHGHGKYIKANGTVEEGEFVRDELHGQGKRTYVGNPIFGRGKFVKGNGTVEEGEFVRGELHGQGKRTYAFGVVEEGEFVRDELHGQGKRTKVDGSVEEGEFVYGELHGQGKRTEVGGFYSEGIFVKGTLSHGRQKKNYFEYIYEGEIHDGQFHGRGRKYNSKGNIFEGMFHKGTFHGRGKYIKADGSYEEGEFVKGPLHHGRAKRRFDDGNIYEGEVRGGKFFGHISNLGDRIFYNFVCRLSRNRAPKAYTLGIMADYLKEKGWQPFADALDSARRLSEISPSQREEESKRIHQALTEEGTSQLFAYGFEGHAMGLNLEPDLSSGFVLCEIFNSGDGLAKYHERHPTDFRKFKTVLLVRVPITSLTPEIIRTFLSDDDFPNDDAAYRAILDLPGAEKISSDAIPWQTIQKGSECTFRWILACLLYKMFLKYGSRESYKIMVRQLRLDSETAYKSRNIDDGLGMDQLRWDKKILPDGSIYEGDFIYGVPHGQGKYTKVDGSFQEGEFFGGKLRNGRMKMRFTEGDSYEGEIRDGKFHGQGKYTEVDGSFQEGEFVEGAYAPAR